MAGKLLRPARQGRLRKNAARRKAISRLIENDTIRRVSLADYRDKVRHVYGGPKGAILATCSKLSLHEPLGERLIRRRMFDLAGAKHILDVGSGAGQILRHLLKYADRDARVTGLDLSFEMLRRSRGRVAHRAPDFVAGDLMHLPFADESFDCITCGYVLEHLPDPRPGLIEMSRVLVPGGRMLLLTTEDNFGGAWTSRVWVCRTYNREELRSVSHDVGLRWRRELWFSPMHKLLRAGGILVDIEKAPD